MSAVLKRASVSSWLVSVRVKPQYCCSVACSLARITFSASADHVAFVHVAPSAVGASSRKTETTASRRFIKGTPAARLAGNPVMG
jgi:hypothetical protein